jgi:hypothetical protein
MSNVTARAASQMLKREWKKIMWLIFWNKFIYLFKKDLRKILI